MFSEMTLHHMNVVRAAAGSRIPLDEPRVEWWAVVAVRRAPEVIVALRLQYRGDPELGRLQIAYLHEHVHDRLRCKARYSRTAEMLDTSDEVIRQAGQQMVLYEVMKLSDKRSASS